MSWSSSLVAANLQESKDEMVNLINHTQSITESVAFDFNDSFLFDEDYSPYLILGANLQSKVGDLVEINGNLAEISKCEYQDERFSVLNLQLTAKFAPGDLVIEDGTQEEYLILEVHPHAYKIDSGFFPLHLQRQLKFKTSK